jgi:MFS family permease
MGKNPINLARGLQQIHYGWIIVGIAATILLVTSSVRFATAALVPYLSDSASGPQWSYGAIGIGFSIQWLALAAVSPYIGWLGDRYGIRKLLLLGGVLFLAGMLLMGMMTSLWQFYLYFGIILGIASSIFTVLLVSGVALWFRKCLGIAMGLIWSFQGIGVLMFIYLISATFEQLGMKWIFWLPGLAGGLLVLLLVKFFSDDPAEKGLRPFGAPEEEPIKKIEKDESAKTRARVFLQQAQRTQTFWNLINIHLWGCMGHQIINVLIVAIAVDRGLSFGAAAGVLAVQQATGVFVRGVVPVIAELVGSKQVWVVGMFLQAFPLLIFLFVQEAWAFYIFAVLFGVGQSCEVPTFPIANRQYYGNVPQGSLYGWQNVGSGLGMGMAPVCGGFIWDLTGSYTAPLIMSFIFSLIGLVSAAQLPSPRIRLTPDWESHLPITSTSPN